MRLHVSGLGAKHELESVADEDTIRSVKSRLEPLTGMSSSEMKLLVKGKAAGDAETVGGLGLKEGAKLMLMRSKLGVLSAPSRTAAPSPNPAEGSPSWLFAGARVLYRATDGTTEAAVVKQVHTDDPAGAYYTILLGADAIERQTSGDRLLRPDEAAPSAAASQAALAPVESGAGPIAVSVSQGKRQFTLRCEGSSEVRALKALLVPLCGATSASMRLLARGKEADDGASVESLGLGAGGKMLLLFRERYHREEEGAAAVEACAAQLGSLRTRIDAVRTRISKRLLAGPEALGALGELDGEVAALTLDLSNAAPAEAAEAARRRDDNLKELRLLAQDLQDARQRAANAELEQQRAS